MTRCFSCGLSIRHHRDAKNRTLSCAEARRIHPRATRRKLSLRTLLRRSL